ncbi:MAG: hypothetical protein JWQ38_3018 [Flavipsychrobacter sp.]|nr:hypothetical protein [Flavipsychrobacter sp.]
MYKQALIAGSSFAAIAVILGAFAAHALKAIVPPEKLIVFETGVRYQFYHSFALIICGIVYAAFPAAQVKLASTFFIAGIIMFSGSLYLMTALSISGKSIGPVGIITPIGGLCFITGWVLLLIAFIKN